MKGHCCIKLSWVESSKCKISYAIKLKKLTTELSSNIQNDEQQKQNEN